jgi:hypothetical protein
MYVMYLRSLSSLITLIFPHHHQYFIHIFSTSEQSLQLPLIEIAASLQEPLFGNKYGITVIGEMFSRKGQTGECLDGASLGLHGE